MFNRRQFVGLGLGSAVALGMGSPLPRVLGQTARRAAASGTRKVLVVLQLSGGNDGLNTLIPFGDDEYYRNRFSLAIPADQVVRMDDYAGMNPAMKPLQTLLDQQRLSFVQGVGYPQPNRSHFESMDLWHTAHRMDEDRVLGWLGRHGDLGEGLEQLPPVHLGGETQPLALAADRRPAMSIRSIETFRFQIAEQKSSLRLLELSNRTERPAGWSGLQHTRSTLEAATVASRRLAELPTAADRGVSYPDSGLGNKFRQIADLIAADIPVQVYYLTLDGFDTHANQLAAHSSLLAEMSGAVSAFVADMVAQGNADRVLVMTFSEFGRRLKENASRGTDHGAASSVQLAGPVLASPLMGKYPSLTDLDEGDLKFGTDYRRLYAAVLEQWLQVDPQVILGKQFEPLRLFG